MRSAWATTYASWQFYENECYGSPAGEKAWDMTVIGISDHYTYPGGHFIEVGDACGLGNPFAITYNGECNSCLVYYGSGCYNINLGWEPTNFMAWCESCSEIPTALRANDCF
jgi:hypothetical protein